MSWGETHRMVRILLDDPSSHIAAAFGEWQYPLTRAELTLRDLYDLQHHSKAKRKPKPYPRPWDPKPKRYGSGGVSVAEFQAMKAGVAPAPQPRDARGRYVARD